MDWVKLLFIPLVTGVVTWIIKSKYEELRAIEEKLREERRKIYSQILDPFIHVFSDWKGEDTRAKVEKCVTSYEYKKNLFSFNLIASDAVIHAYNELYRYGYKAKSLDNQNLKKMPHLFGKVLLEIRKNLGNKRTKLNELEMLEIMIKDIEQLKSADSTSENM